MTESKQQYCVLIAHFGSLPKWFELWRHTAKRNPNVDFIVLQDQRPSQEDDNVILVNHSLDRINQLPFMKAEGLRCQSPYKVCDLRPLFASVFSDCLDGYAYWGWGDLDVIYGDLNSAIGASFGRFDYISTGWDGESGPLAFIKNSSLMNEMWKRVDGIHEIVNSEKPFAADEKHIVRLFKQHARCDIVFRECLHDLPAWWRGGKLVGTRTGKEYALFHFGSRLKGMQAQIGAASGGILANIDRAGGFDILSSYQFVFPAKNPIQKAWRRLAPILVRFRRAALRRVRHASL